MFSTLELSKISLTANEMDELLRRGIKQRRHMFDISETVAGKGWVRMWKKELPERPEMKCSGLKYFIEN